KRSRSAGEPETITSRLPGEYRSSSEGLSTRQRTEMSGGRGGDPSRRGRSEDHPVRSSAPILTLRVVGSSAMPTSSRIADAGRPVASLTHEAAPPQWDKEAATPD